MERKPWVSVTRDHRGVPTWRAFVPVGQDGAREVASWTGQGSGLRAQAWLFNFGCGR